MGTGPELDGILSRTVRDGCWKETRYQCFVSARSCRGPRGRASRVLDPTPEWEGIIFPGASGRVLMTAGYPLSRLLFVVASALWRRISIPPEHERKEWP